MLVQDNILEPIFRQNSTTAYIEIFLIGYVKYSFERIMVIVFLCLFFLFCYILGKTERRKIIELIHAFLRTLNSYSEKYR